jgi:hypothetical protein
MPTASVSWVILGHFLSYRSGRPSGFGFKAGRMAS